MRRPVCMAVIVLVAIAAVRAADTGDFRALTEKTTDKRAGRDFWSLQPVGRPDVPDLHSPWVRNPVDAFIIARLRAAGLEPSPEADKRTLIRRLSFDLTGLPPTPEEVAAFEDDGRADAYEQLVERLLASPRYGERWARHWLDIAHYADTHGFERDQRRDNAWRYRDYVIESLNADKPYDRFLLEQIAGDVLAPGDEQAVIATGFLAAGPFDFVGQQETKSDALRRAARADDLDDMVTQVMAGTTGLTVNCARCHDHKVDPIAQEDYYRLWAVFAGVKRGDRDVSAAAAESYKKHGDNLAAGLRRATTEIARLESRAVDLADIAGGGDGRGTGAGGYGIDPRDGRPRENKLGYLDGAAVNVYQRFKANAIASFDEKLIDGVVIPDGGPDGTTPVPISSTGLSVSDVPATSGKAWDAIRRGPVNAQAFTTIGPMDYNSGGHSLLAVHANAAITFDLAAIRKQHELGELRLTAVVGYGGRDGHTRADFSIYLDGVLAARRMKMGRADSQPVDVAVPASARFLTLMSTDGGDGIGHDQLFFGDARLTPATSAQALTPDQKQRLTALRAETVELRRQIAAMPSAPRFYGVVPQQSAPTVSTLRRGDIDSPIAEVTPGGPSCIAGLPADFGDNQTPEGQRRLALAKWITDAANPLTRRVIVNRLWHHHFGQGIVNTPSDFGFIGDRPSHPELLDYLADELLQSGWSLKHVHRLIVNSAAYRQSSAWTEKGAAADGANRLLWRGPSRRLDAESTRDTILAVSGKLNEAMGGPGYRDFTYKEEYAPVYTYITADEPGLWRRSIYRFVVRTTPQRFMSVLDCPSASTLTPARSQTTTALQSLALLNNDFVLRQSRGLADRLRAECGDDPAVQVRRGFALAFGRGPTADELGQSESLVRREGLFYLCRVIFNANEFVHVD